MNDKDLGFIPEGGDQEQSQQSASKPANDLGFMPEHIADQHQDLGFMPESPEPTKPQENPYESLGQQLATGLENAASGATFGLSRGLESHLGIATPEEQEARNQANPGIAAVSNIAGAIAPMALTGGTAGIIPIAEEASALARVGGTAIRSAIDMGAIQSGNEISDAFLGKSNGMVPALGHIAESGALGLLTGGIFGAGQAGLHAARDTNIAKHLTDFKIGLGEAVTPGGTGLLEKLESQNIPISSSMKKGMEFYDKLHNMGIEHAIGKAADLAAAGAGAAAGSVLGPAGTGVGTAAGYALAQKYIEPIIEKTAGKYLVGPAVRRVAVPIMLRALGEEDVKGMANLLSYGYKASKGADLIKNSVDALFKSGSNKVLDRLTNPKHDDDLDKYIEDGGIDQQIEQLRTQPDTQTPQFAQGGKVMPKPVNQDDALSRLYPDQNLALNMARGRISNYLSALKPRESAQLPFDKPYQDMDHHRSYRNALTIANNPLKILEKVSKGTVVPEDMRHFKSLYPDLHEHLSQKITKKLMEHKMDEEKPSFRKLQSISMFLGTPLTSDMKASSIQAAQMALAPQGNPQQQEQQGKLKKGTKPLEKISKSYETAEQARSARANKD